MSKGYFFVLEGGEGSGKTTAVNNVKEILETKYNQKVIITREPGGDEISEKIRNLIFDYEINPKTEALLFAAARCEHLNNKLLKYLSEGYIVLCDRYVLSSLVYQGYARNLGVDTILNINEWAIDNFYPSQTYFLDIDPIQALERINSDETREKNRFDLEDHDFHIKLNKGYKEFADKMSNIVEIDANRSKDDVAKDISTNIINYINE